VFGIVDIHHEMLPVMDGLHGENIATRNFSVRYTMCVFGRVAIDY